MKKIYLVSYDFKNPADRYSAFFDALKGFDGWWHFIDGTWLIATDLDAEAIRQQLMPFLDDEFNLLIAEVGNDMAGWLPKKAWDWIRQHRPSPTHREPSVMK